MNTYTRSHKCIHSRRASLLQRLAITRSPVNDHGLDNNHNEGHYHTPAVVEETDNSDSEDSGSDESQSEDDGVSTALIKFSGSYLFNYPPALPL